MKYFILLGSCVFMILFSACEEALDTSMLQGDWQAYEYLANGNDKGVDPSLIKFTFPNQQHYHFQGGLKYREAGNFHIKGRLLYTTDTLNTQRIEKVVKIAHLTKDSMFLQMNNGGIEEEFRLLKTK